MRNSRPAGKFAYMWKDDCRFVDPLDRAAEVFAILKMGRTANHNAVLIYLAVKDRQLAVFGDQGIHEKVGEEFWRKEVNTYAFPVSDRIIMQRRFQKLSMDIGAALKYHFPYDRQTDINELPDDIVFGR